MSLRRCSTVPEGDSASQSRRVEIPELRDESSSDLRESPGNGASDGDLEIINVEAGSPSNPGVDEEENATSDQNEEVGSGSDEDSSSGLTPWSFVLPTLSSRKSIEEVLEMASSNEDILYKIPKEHDRPWTAPPGYICLYESYFRRCHLWLPLPHLLISYCERRRIAISQLSATSIRHIVGILLLAAEMDTEISCRDFEQMSSFGKNKDSDVYFHVKMKPAHGIITGAPTKIPKWSSHYFFVKASELTVPDPNREFRVMWNTNTVEHPWPLENASKDFFAKVEQLRSFGHLKWPDVSAERIKNSLSRILKVDWDTEEPCEPNRKKKKMGKVKRNVPSYAVKLQRTPKSPKQKPEEAVGGDKASEESTRMVQPTAPVDKPIAEIPRTGPTIQDKGKGKAGAEKQTDENDDHQTAKASKKRKSDSVPGGGEATKKPKAPEPSAMSRKGGRLDADECADLVSRMGGPGKDMPAVDALLNPGNYRNFARALARVAEYQNESVVLYESQLKELKATLDGTTKELEAKKTENKQIAGECIKIHNAHVKLRASLKAAQEENAKLKVEKETEMSRLRKSREECVARARERTEKKMAEKFASKMEKFKKYLAEQEPINSTYGLYVQAKGLRECLQGMIEDGIPIPAETFNGVRGDEIRYNGVYIKQK